MESVETSVLSEVSVNMVPRKSPHVPQEHSILTIRVKIAKIVLPVLQESIVLEAAAEHLLEIARLATTVHLSQQ